MEHSGYAKLTADTLSFASDFFALYSIDCEALTYLISVAGNLLSLCRLARKRTAVGILSPVLHCSSLPCMG